MKRFIQDPLRAFLSIIGIAFVLFLFTLSLPSCESRSERNFKQAQETKQAIEVVNHNAKAIIIETLHDGYIAEGVHKISVDSANQFIIVKTANSGQGVAIARLK